MEEIKRCFRLGVVILGADGVVRSANAAAEVILDAPGAGGVVGEAFEVTSTPESACTLRLRSGEHGTEHVAECLGRAYWDGEPAYFALLIDRPQAEPEDNIAPVRPAVETTAMGGAADQLLDAYTALHALE